MPRSHILLHNNFKTIAARISFVLFTTSILFIDLSTPVNAQDGEKFTKPLQVRFFRIYGGDNERQPPVLLKEGAEVNYKIPFAQEYITIEFDVDAPITPNIVARFVHCSFDWKEDENIFLNDIITNRTTIINFETAPMLTRYYNYRGRIRVPNQQVHLKYSGNWKVKLYEYGNEENPIAEGKFFVVDPIASCRVNVYNEFYLPDVNVSPTCFNLEAAVVTSKPIIDSRMNTAVFYRNQRWDEPYIVTDRSYSNPYDNLFKYRFKRYVGGFAGIEKKFRIEKIPAETDYRVLNMSNTALFPAGSAPVRLPLSDLRRTGTAWELDDDGVMITGYIPDENDDYVNMEFLLDPDNWISERDVFLVGSFNGWKPSVLWQMHFDAELRMYKCRNMVRRAKHNYMYVTGTYNVDNNQIEKLSSEEYEGNSSSNDNSFLGFIYYREIELGGYDALISVGSGNIFGNSIR